MKFCTHCGAELVDDAVVCTSCGRLIASNPVAPKPESGLSTAAKVLMILGTVIMAFTTYGIGLAWCIPMTVSYFKKIKNGLPISTGFKVCSLLFVSMIGGILMLCDKDH